MKLSPIGYQPNFNGYFDRDKTTLNILKDVDKNAIHNLDRAELKKSLVDLKSFYPSDVYRLEVKDVKVADNMPAYKYLYMKNKRTGMSIHTGIYNNGGISGALNSLIQTLLNLGSEEAVDFVSGKPDLLDLATSDKSFSRVPFISEDIKPGTKEYQDAFIREYGYED